VTERETTRLIAWGLELRRVHDRLREALELTRTAVRDGLALPDHRSEALMFCRGFCSALDGHHTGEDRALFPAIEAAHPELGPVLRALQQDHEMIGNLLAQLSAATVRSAAVDELDRHLEGIEAVMESHFRYEERQLLTVLETLELNVPVAATLGPL